MYELNELNVIHIPAIIKIEDKEKIERDIKELSATYENYLVTAETFKDDKKLLSELRKVSRSLDDERKRVKNDFNKPLSEFEKWVKEACEPLTKVIKTIDVGVKDIEEKVFLERTKIVQEAITELTKETSLDLRIFDGLVMETAKSGTNFNKNKELTNSAAEGIQFVVDREIKKIEEDKQARKAISSFSFDNNLSETPYLKLYQKGESVAEIMQTIGNDAKRIREETERRAKEEAERKAQEEARRKAQQEAQMLEQASVTLEKEVEAQINAPLPETEETQATETNATPATPNNQYPARLVISITLESEERKDEFKRLLAENGFAYQAESFRPLKEVQHD